MLGIYIGTNTNNIEDAIFNPAALATKDGLVCQFSLFRGPNRVVWYCYQPSKYTIQNMSASHEYTLLVKDRDVNIQKVSLKLDSIYWNLKRECWEYTFIPYAKYFCRESKDIYLQGNVNLEDVLKQIIKDTGIKLVTSGDIKKILFNGFHRYGVLEDIIADLARDFGFEFGFLNKNLCFGNLITSKLFRTYTLLDNTISKYDYGGKEIIVSRLIGDTCPLPGTNIAVGVVDTTPRQTRIVFTQYRFVGKETKCNFIGTDTAITEFDLCHLLPEEINGQLNHLITIEKTYLRLGQINNVQKEGEELVQFGTHSNDAANLKFSPDKKDARVVVSSPYAGETVGLQFPANKNAIALVANPFGNSEMGAQIGQIFQDKFPKRDTLDDFRLTLPDGGTLYYDKANKTWILASKTEVLIGLDDNSSYDKVPAPTGKYIEITSEGISIIGNSKKLATENHVHNMEHTHVATAPGAPTAPITTSVTPGGPAKTGKPDKITEKVTGDETTNPSAATT